MRKSNQTKSTKVTGTTETSEIRSLIDFISKSGLNEVNIETKDLKLHVKREPDQKVLKSTPVVTQVAPAAAAPRAEKPAASSEEEKNIVEIKSPMIGTFYSSANPDSPPFVSVGHHVSKGQVVCIIEAMKLFNEIESEVSGTITRMNVENATPVEYDEVLFVVEPD